MLPAEELPYLTFVDLGSGRGRVVMEAARRDFEHIIGVEKDPALHEDAAINLRHWPRSIMQCRDVDLVCADVEKWKWPRQDLVMYVFLDFSERAMMNLYARFNRHVQDGHRLYLVMIDRTGRMPLNESPYFAEIEQPARDRTHGALVQPLRLPGLPEPRAGNRDNLGQAQETAPPRAQLTPFTSCLYRYSRLTWHVSPRLSLRSGTARASASTRNETP